MPGKPLNGQSADELAPVVLDKQQTVTAIKQQVKRADRYSVFVNGKYAFSLSDGGLLDSRIYVGQPITDTELAALKDTAAVDKLYGLTLAYVMRRLRSEWELHDYFRRKQADDEVAEAVLGRLRAYGYVDDLTFARSWVDNRRALKQVSRRRIIMELRQKRIPDYIVQQIMAEDEIPDSDSLRQLVVKKRTQSRYQDDQKLMQHLARQGFGYDDIKRALTANDADV